MSRREVTQFSAFEFRADFAAPAPEPASRQRPEETAPEEECVSIPVMELAALGAQLQAEASEAARRSQDDALAERLEAAAARLDEALHLLAELAASLDLAARMGQVPAALVDPAEKAARALCDGQGDLFAACKQLTPSDD